MNPYAAAEEHIAELGRQLDEANAFVQATLDIIHAGVECNAECPWCPAAGLNWELHDPECCARRVLEHRTDRSG